MSCKIQKNNKNGKINGILNQDGEKSTLFQQIFNTPTLSLNESIDIYKNVYSNKLKDTVRYQIIGEKGAQNLDQVEEATFRLDNLAVAKEMEQAGKSQKEIRLATGWEKSAKDQKWRYEIQDGTFNEVPLNYNVTTRLMEEPVAKTSLSEIYNNKELFKAYPKLKNISVYIYNTDNTVYDENKMFAYDGSIYINSRTYDTEKDTLRFSTGEGKELVHEIQHLLQSIEGFGTGSSKEYNRRKITETLTQLRDNTTGVEPRSRAKTEYSRYIESIFRKSFPTDKVDGLLYENIVPIEILAEKLKTQVYESFAGEVEARNVENRFFMSAQERLQKTLEDTQEIPYEDQFLQGVEAGVQASAQKTDTIQKVVDRLKQTGLAENVYQLTTEEINVKLKELGQDDIDNLTGGFVYGKDVYLNSNVANNSTVLHEFQHLFSAWIKVNRPELYNRGINLAKAELAKENSEIKDVIDYVKTAQPNLTEEALLEEIVAELTGRKGVELLESGKKSSIVDWLKEFWSEVKNMLGILEATPEQVANMTLGDFAKANVTQLLSGKIIEPSATFNNFNTYTEAVKNTPINDIIKIDIEGINVGQVTNNGDINDLIRQDIIADQRELSPSGNIVFVTKGNSLAKKLVNAEIAREIVKGRVNEEGNIIAREKVELTEVSEDFNKNKKEFGEETALVILGAKILKENTPAFGNNRIIDYSIEIPSDNVLMTKLKNILQELGVKTMSLETWAENYKKRTGEEPNPNSLADISNKIVAFANGEITQDRLTEEAMHFVIEALPQEEIQPLLDMIHKTDEWKEYAQQYTEIYKDDAVVRKEILGKVLKNRIQGKAEQSTLQGQSITRRLAELINRFFEQVRGLFKPQHQQQLDKFSEEIYQKLMAEELYSELSPEQFDGNKMVMYQTAPDPIYDQLTKTIENFTKIDKATGGANKFELSELDITNLDELHQLKTTASIAALIKTKIKHLTKRGRQEGFLSSEEQVVYDTIQRELFPILQGLKEIISEKVIGNTVMKQKVIDDVTNTITSLSELSAALNKENEDLFETLVDNIANQTGLSDAMKEVLKAEIRTQQRDTNQFFALYGNPAQANNAILNMLGVVGSDITRETAIQFSKRQSAFISNIKALGYKEEEIADALKSFKDGYYFISKYDLDAIEREEASFKVEAYKEVTGENVSIEEMIKEETTLVKKLSKEQMNSYNLRAGEKTRKSGMLIDKLKEEERKKIDNVTENFSELTKRFLIGQSRGKSAVMKRARENGGMSLEDNDILKTITKAQQKFANPYDEEGNLLKGLQINEDGTIQGKEGVELTPKEQSVVEINEYNRKRLEEYKNEGSEKKKNIVPQSFIDKIKNLTIDKASEFLRLNTRISYNNNFWDTFDKSSGFTQKLRETEEDKAIKKADEIDAKRTRLKNILKEYRQYSNPSQIDYESMSRNVIESVKDISSDLEHLYEQAKNYLKDSENINQFATISEAITNEAYNNQLQDRGLFLIGSRKEYEERLDFILRHVTPNNRSKIIRNAENFIRYKKGEYSNLPKSMEKFHTNSFNKSFDDDIAVYEDIVNYAESMLLPYFKELKPAEFSMQNFIMELSKTKTEEDFNRVVEDAKYVSVTPAYAMIDSEDNDRLNSKYVENEKAGEPMINLEYKNKDGKQIFKNTRYKERFLDENGNIKKDKEKEHELLSMAISFWEDSIKAADMEGKHNKYQLPGIRRESMARKEQLIKNFSAKNIKESLKDIVTVREADPEFGQSIDNKTYQSVSKGALVVPRIGFSKLETSEEVTDEVLYSLMHTANESEKRKQRIAALGKIEAIKARLKNESYGNKSGEATESYKMADDFVRYNIYGQTETLTAETDFGGLLSEKVNIAPTIKHFQSWVRLVNLGFKILTPLTSFLQGSANFIVETVVGDRINKDASKIASKKVGKMITEATSDQFLSNIKAKGELNLLLHFFGLENPVERYKNSNYGRFLRGMAIDKSAFFSHYMADVPLTAQVVMTVLHDFKVVTDKTTGSIKLQSYSEWRNENKAAKMFGKETPMTEKEARAEWKLNENYLYNYMEIEKDVAGDVMGIRMSDKYLKAFPNKEEYATDRLNFVKRRMQTAKQEIDNQISQEDKSKIQRHAIYSFFSLHKGFLITSLTKRIKDKHNNLYTNQYEEGTYNGTANFLAQLIKSTTKGSLKDFWKEQYREYSGSYKMVTKGDVHYLIDTSKKEDSQILLKSTDKEYIEKAYTEMKVQMSNMRQLSLKRASADAVLITSLATIALLLKGYADDDKDDDYAKEFAAYMSYRLAVESTSQSTGLPGQVYSFLQSPTTGLSQINNILHIGDLTSGEMVKSGGYKGYSERQALLLKSLPGIKSYYELNHIDRVRDSFIFNNKHFINNFNFAALMFDEESRK